MHEWISVNEKTPETKNPDGFVLWKKSEDVLVICKSGRIAVANYYTDKGGNYWGGYDMVHEIVTHWMPLPEPPK